jgi:hypothetical protein
MDGVALDVRRELGSRAGGRRHAHPGGCTDAGDVGTLASAPGWLGSGSYQQLLDLARREAAERYLSDSPLSDR